MLDQTANGSAVTASGSAVTEIWLYIHSHLIQTKKRKHPKQVITQTTQMANGSAVTTVFHCLVRLTITILPSILLMCHMRE